MTTGGRRRRGMDPSTGERIVLTQSVLVEPPGDEKAVRVARVQAEKVLTRLLADADELKVARTRSTMGALLLDRWLQHEYGGHHRGGMARDAEFGLYLWVSAVTGSRRGEAIAIRFDNIDRGIGHLWIQENWVWASAGLLMKDTKTRQ